MQPSSEPDASPVPPENPGIDLQLERLPQTVEAPFEGSIDL